MMSKRGADDPSSEEDASAAKVPKVAALGSVDKTVAALDKAVDVLNSLDRKLDKLDKLDTLEQRIAKMNDDVNSKLDAVNTKLDAVSDGTNAAVTEAITNNYSEIAGLLRRRFSVTQERHHIFLRPGLQ